MRHAIVSELMHRRSRTLALLLGILIATAAFTVLTGTSETQRLEARGTVERSFRGDYDVLVRPRGSRSEIERRSGQAPPNFLSELYEGITHAQWRRIQRLPGVEVAAPIANVGYVLATARVPVDISAAAGTSGRVLLRARIAWRSENGLTRVRDRPNYAYVTPNRLRNEPDWWRDDLPYYRRFSLREDVPGRRRPVPVCFSLWIEQPETVIEGPFGSRWRSNIGCFSRRTGTGRVDWWRLRRSPPRIDLRWEFPLLLTAIDPESEARLTGLDRALVSGRYLARGDRARLTRQPRGTDDYPPRVLPVLAASRTYVAEQAEVAVERLSAAAADRWARPFETHEDVDTLVPLRFLARQPRGPVVQRATVSAATAYRHMLEALRSDVGKGFNPNYQTQDVSAVRRVDPVRYRREHDVLAARSRPWDKTDWPEASSGVYWARVTPAVRDDSLREVRLFLAGPAGPRESAPSLHAVGTFDPDRLGAAPEPGAPPLSTMQSPLLTARDGATAALLGGRPLRPNGSVAGYIAQPPGLITTLAGARAFGDRPFAGLYPSRAISAVRVRVDGVTGIDAVSRERIRQAAERIAAATGLDVDITAGASGAPTAVDLPAGRFWRPKLALTETWVRRGVAARVLTAVDRKSLLLFALILVVCALFVTNAASAAVRARRDELGVLACLGWSTGRLFAVVLAEVALVGFAAGVLGGLLALPLAAVVGVDASPARAALAVPATTGLALLAGLVCARRDAPRSAR